MIISFYYFIVAKYSISDFWGPGIYTYVIGYVFLYYISDLQNNGNSISDLQNNSNSLWSPK